MDCKSVKSRSLVLRKCKVTDQFRFSVGGIQIPSVREKTVKCLGKLYDCTLRDTAALQETTDQLGTWLTAVDKSGLPGNFKA